MRTKRNAETKSKKNKRRRSGKKHLDAAEEVVRRRKPEEPTLDSIDEQMEYDLTSEPDVEESEADRKNRLQRESIETAIETMENQEEPDSETLTTLKERLKKIPKPISSRAAKDRQVLATQIWKGELKLQDFRKEAEQKVQKATEELKELEKDYQNDLDELAKKHLREMEVVNSNYQKMISEVRTKIEKANEKVEEAERRIRAKQQECEDVIQTIRVDLPGVTVEDVVDTKCSVASLDQTALCQALMKAREDGTVDFTEAQAMKAIAIIIEQAGQIAAAQDPKLKPKPKSTASPGTPSLSCGSAKADIDMPPASREERGPKGEGGTKSAEKD